MTDLATHLATSCLPVAAALLEYADLQDAMARQLVEDAPALARATSELAGNYRDLSEMLTESEEARRRIAEGASDA